MERLGNEIWALARDVKGIYLETRWEKIWVDMVGTLSPKSLWQELYENMFPWK